MFCKESLGKIKFRAFSKRVGPRILSLESVDYFGASEHYCVLEKKKRISISEIALVGCCKISLCADESCDEHAIYFRQCRIEMTCHFNHFFDLWQWCNFSGIETLEFSCIYTRK